MNPTNEFGPHLQHQAAKALEPFERLNQHLSENLFSAINLEDFNEALRRQIQTAEKQFTICFYGSFNSGKSTIINALLGLTGDRRLSTENSPDTARSIRLQKRENPEHPEVLLTFKDRKPEPMSWAQARVFTSQVQMNKNGVNSNEVIEEVNYFPEECPLLEWCNIIDLPGTGAAQRMAHDTIANERIKESEIIFWVISTAFDEIDGNELKNLKNMQAINAKVIPLINVYQDKAAKKVLDIDLDQYIRDVNHHYKKHFNHDPDVKIIYAREAERAIEEFRQPEPYTGYEDFITFLKEDFLKNDLFQWNERIRRIASVMAKASDDLFQQTFLSEEKITKKLEEIKLVNNEEIENLSKIENITEGIRTIMDPSAEDCADKIIEIFKDEAILFIKAKTDGLNLKPLQRYSDQKAVDARLKKEFEERYLEIDKPDSPINVLLSRFLDLAYRQSKLSWQRYMDALKPEHTGIDPNLGARVGNFIDHMAGPLAGFRGNQALDILIGGSVVFGGPWGILIGGLAWVFKEVFGKKKEVMLNEMLDNAKIKILKYKESVANNLMKQAMEINESIKQKFMEEWNKRNKALAAEEQHFIAIKNMLTQCEKALERFQKEMKSWEASQIQLPV